MSSTEGAVYLPVAAGVAASEYSKQPEEVVVLGHAITVEAGSTRWRECTTATECTEGEQTSDSGRVLGIDKIGCAASPLGDGEVDVPGALAQVDAHDGLLARGPA
jgi:hypothetical protein